MAEGCDEVITMEIKESVSSWVGGGVQEEKPSHECRAIAGCGGLIQGTDQWKAL
jgi:hypothetical protein